MAFRDIRGLAENVLERVEARWDQAMDLLHGRPIRDPYLDDPRQQPHPPGQLPPPPQGNEQAGQEFGIFEPGDYVKIAGLEFDRVPMAGEVGPVRVHDVEYGHVAMLPASTRTLDDAMAWMESPAGRAAILEVANRWNEYYQQSPAASAEHAADFAERQNRHRENIRDRAERAGTAVEHEPTAAELAVNEEYEKAMWPDIEEDEPDLDPVRTISMGEWLVPEPGVETRLHLGQSDAGFHYYVETSRLGGDDGGPYWSQPYASREQADDAGSRRLQEVHYPELASDEPTDPRARVDRLLDDMPSSMHYYYDLEERDGGYAVVKCWQMMDEDLAERGIQNAEQQVAWAPDLNELHDKIVQRFFPDRVQAQSHSVTEVRARDRWEDQRSEILEAPISSQRKEQELESLGPEPSDEAKVWLNGQGQRIEQPSVELQPVEIERPTTEERADRDEHALGLEREEERSQEAAELEL